MGVVEAVEVLEEGIYLAVVVGEEYRKLLCMGKEGEVK